MQFLRNISFVFMVLLLGVVCCENIDDSIVNLTKAADDSILIFVQTICRHGDRTNYRTFPTDPWDHPEFWPEGFAELTNKGKQQLCELGKYLRQRYSKLIGNGDYSPQKVYVHSTDIDRVLMSASACLAGLFPPRGDQKWNNQLDWQPIPVHTEPRNSDFLLSPEKPCDRFDCEMIEFTNTTEYKSLFEENESFIKYLEEKSQQKLESITSLHHLYDQLLVSQLRGYRLPSWAEQIMNDGKLEYFAKYFFTIFTHTTEMKKLRSGFLLKELLDRFRDKTRSSLSPDPMFMYFAHDTTIANMLNSLKVFELHIPSYASCLFFDLYKTDTGNYVQLFYKNTTELGELSLPALDIPNCGTKCELDKWYELYKDILPVGSYDEECRLRDGETLPASGNPEFVPITNNVH